MLNISDWDDGKKLFAKLQKNEFFSWDIRDQYSVDCVEKILAELTVLEPTKFIAVSYVSLLLKQALMRSTISLETAVLSDNFPLFAEELRIIRAELDDYANPKLDIFIGNIQAGMERLCGSSIKFRDEIDSKSEGWINHISRDEIPLLARDAVIATKIPLHWIYTSDQRQGVGQLFKVLHSDILLFPSLSDLELSIHEHEFAYGFRYVTVNNGGSSLHAIVYTSPDVAFIMAELNWHVHDCKMVGGNSGYSFHNDGLDKVRQHYPNLDRENKLMLAISGFQIIGSIKTCPERSKIWLLMLTELMSVKLENLCPVCPKMSIRLLTATSNKLLPVSINIPFILEHKDIATVAREIGVDESPMKSELWDIVETLRLDDLLPRDGKFYFNVRTGDRTESISDRDKYSQRFRYAIVRLYPFPEEHFGTKASTAEAVNFVLAKNLPAIINAKLEDKWLQDFESQQEWFASMLKKRKAHISNNVLNWHEEEREQGGNTLNYNQYMVTGIHEKCRRLAIKTNTKVKFNSITAGIPALYKGNPKRQVLGIVTGNEYTAGCDHFTIVPNNAAEIMEVLKCKETDLPALFQGWQRWADHGSISYPWRRVRGSGLRIAVLGVYY
ncbi:MAG: hypothetical protein V7749_00845 [Cocleimonas sp.]